MPNDNFLGDFVNQRSENYYQLGTELKLKASEMLTWCFGFDALGLLKHESQQVESFRPS